MITIADPGMSRAAVKRQPGLLDVLSLHFHDAEPWSGNPPNIRLMDDWDSRAIHDFVVKWKGEADALVVNCVAGMSRSPAVAIGICQAMGWPCQDIIEDSQPNDYVLNFVLDTFRNTQ